MGVPRRCSRPVRKKTSGWAMSFSPDSRLTMKALEMAWEIRGKPGGVMFHSDSNNTLSGVSMAKSPENIG